MPRLRPCLITCLSLVEEPPLPPDGPGLVSRHADILRSCFRSDPKDLNPFEKRVCFMGPQLLRIVPLDSDANSAYPVGLLFDELIHLIHGNANLGRFMLPMGGVVMLGTVLDDREAFIGHGITQALQRRSLCAGLPRIVVAPDALEALETEPLLRKDTHTVKQEQEYIRRMLFRDRDGLWVLDPLKGMRGECDGDDEYARLLHESAECLKRQLRLARKRDIIDDRARALGWLRQYHNRRVDCLFSKQPAGREEPTEVPEMQAVDTAGKESSPVFAGFRRADLRVPRIGPICYAL